MPLCFFLLILCTEKVGAMKYDLFISYSRKDFNEVRILIEALKNAIPSLNFWFDIDGVESGDEFEDRIITAIDNSSYVLFALSDNSLKSSWTKDEIVYARNTDKKIIPVLLKGAKLKGWFLFKFGRIDCVDVTDNLQFDKLIKNLSSWTNKKTIEFPSGEKHPIDNAIPSKPIENKVIKHSSQNLNQNSRSRSFSIDECIRKAMAFDGVNNYAEAFKWYYQAAEQGDAFAQHKLAVRYEYGLGASSSKSDAVKWYRLAAEQGHDAAIARLKELGCMELSVDERVRKAMAFDSVNNYVEAFKWYYQAAEQGDALAQYKLAVRYEYGLGVSSSKSDAVKWYRLAAEQGNNDAIARLKELGCMELSVDECTRKAIAFDGVNNYDEAFKWYYQAAEQGDALAQYKLAVRYEYGLGVSSSKSDAVKWYRLAAGQGQKVAEDRLKELEAEDFLKELDKK